SGRATGTTSAVTPGRKSAIGAIDATTGSPHVAHRNGRPVATGDTDRDHARARRPGLARAPRRPACRRAPDRRGWLPGRAFLLDCLVTRGLAACAYRREHRRRRGVAVSDP